jgi:hypothetical protein
VVIFSKEFFIFVLLSLKMARGSCGAWKIGDSYHDGLPSDDAEVATC